MATSAVIIASIWSRRLADVWQLPRAARECQGARAGSGMDVSIHGSERCRITRTLAKPSRGARMQPEEAAILACAAGQTALPVA
eukprot:5815888-Alexandrium_andersonii.AAC.1